MNKAFEKIIERIDKEIPVYTGKAKQIVQEVAEEYNGGWIPCRERLPEETLNSVLGFDEYRNRCCFVQYYDGRWVLGNDIETVKIIAWQPLPEPYKN